MPLNRPEMHAEGITVNGFRQNDASRRIKSR